MGQILSLDGSHHLAPRPGRHPAQRGPKDPAATARGILLGLALSCLAWIGLALLVPRLW